MIKKINVGLVIILIMSSAVFAGAEEKILIVPATSFVWVSIPAGEKMVLTSVDARKWSHDPMASAQNLMMFPGVSFSIKIDEKTVMDIESLFRDKQILVCKDSKRRVLNSIGTDVKRALTGNREVIVSGLEGRDGWVISEVWKKYLHLRHPDLEINTSFEGACGEEDDMADASNPKKEFLGDFPGVGLPIGAVIAISKGQKPVRFCKYGDVVENNTSHRIGVEIGMNDDQLHDNSGSVEIRYQLQNHQ